MKALKTIPFFPFLLVAFFILHGTVENFELVYLNEILNIGFTILLTVAVFYLIIKLIVKNAVYAALICFFISTWMLFFGAITDGVKSIHFLYWLHSYSVFVPFMFCTCILFILFIRKKINLQNKLCFYLNLLLLIYCAFDLSGLILKSVQKNDKPVGGEINFDTSMVKAKPNVYFLLFDEYPGYKSLKDSFAFSNDSLYQFLGRKEFKLLPTVSNYNMTTYSMASMLNLHYIDKPYQPLANTLEDEVLRLIEIKNAPVVRYFKSIGYTFTNYSIFNILDRPSVKESPFFIGQAAQLTNKTFFIKILKDLGWHFISGRYKIGFIEYLAMEEDRNNKFIERRLREVNPQSTSSPQFIYAHFNMPHSPIFCDSLGNYLPALQIFDKKSYTSKQTFLSYLKFANKKIEQVVDTLCKNDPNSIFIVMSDHGYRGYNNNSSLTEPFVFDNICAVRFPDKNYLPLKEKWSNVNFFRYLFNCEFNQKIPYLRDSSIFLRDKQTVNETD